MAKRYSGDIEIRLLVKPYKGWSGKRELFYFASVRCPGHRGRGILSPRECGVKGDPRTPAAYDRAAMTFIAMAHRKHGIAKYCEIADGEIQLDRIQHAPCPAGMSSHDPKKERFADLQRQGFMRTRSRKTADERPVVACDDCLNWHRKGKHTATAAERKVNRETRQR